MLTPTLSHLQVRTAQRIWFQSWNAANQAAREAYDVRLCEIAEKDRAIADWHERQKLREARIVTDTTCKSGRHELAKVGVTWTSKGYWRCRACTNERARAERRRKGIKPRARFQQDREKILRKSYESGQTVKHLAQIEGASLTAVTNAIRRAGGKIRTRTESAELRRRTGRKR